MFKLPSPPGWLCFSEEDAPHRRHIELIKFCFKIKASLVWCLFVKPGSCSFKSKNKMFPSSKLLSSHLNCYYKCNFRKIKFKGFLYSHNNQCILSIDLFYQLFILTFDCFDDYLVLIWMPGDKQIWQQEVFGLLCRLNKINPFKPSWDQTEGFL